MYNPEKECENLITAIKIISASKGLSQNALAKKAGISVSTLNGLYKDKTKPTMYTIFKICNALDITVPDLLQGGELNLAEEEIELLAAYRYFPDYKKKQTQIFMKMMKDYDRKEKDKKKE
ncbi:MAG: helix-turn-helix transcriptional regulator [Clostridiales bacterium]|nr:helix-turn-helix transcriptional regulator [Clostridiales bacterium]